MNRIRSRNGRWLANGVAGFVDPIFQQRKAQVVANALRALSGVTANAVSFLERGSVPDGMDPRRSIFHECGYPTTGEITPAKWAALANRNPLAKRVVEFMPKECFKVLPLVYEVEDEDQVTAFEEALDGLGAQLQFGESFWRDAGAQGLMSVALQADILSGVGRWGGIVLGLNDGIDPRLPAKGVEERGSKPFERDPDSPTPKNGDGSSVANYRWVKTKRPLVLNADGFPVPPQQGNAPDEPFAVEPKPEAQKGRKLLWTRALSEAQLDVLAWEGNPLSPRFGMPVQYQASWLDPNDWLGGRSLQSTTMVLHWTRVVHLADWHHMACGTPGVAKPRCLPVLNNLLACDKIYGGSGEGYWKMCMAILAAVTHPQLGGEVDVDDDEIRDMFEELMNGLQRYGVFKGMDLKSVGPSVTDPTPFLNAHIQAVCIANGWPQRIFMGSERGELASGQDVGEHAGRVKERQANYVTASVIVPLWDRLVLVGALPRPNVKQVPEGPQLGDEEEGAKDEEFRSPDEAELERGEGDEPSDEDRPVKRQLRAPKRPAFPPAFSRNARQRHKWHLYRNGPIRRKLLLNAEGRPVADPRQAARMIMESRTGYTVEWPDLSEASEQEKATNFSAWMAGWSAYVSGNVESVIPYERALAMADFDRREIEEMVDEVEQQEEELAAEQEALAAEHGFDPLPPEGMVDPEMQDMEHEEKMAAAKNPAKGALPFGAKGPPKPGGKPFPPKEDA